MLVDNTYYSTYSPDIQIKVSSDYSYHPGESGHFQHQFKHRSELKYISIHHITEPPNTTQVDYYYNPSNWIFWDIPPSEKIDSGTVNILNKTWYFCHSFRPLLTGACALLKDIAIFTEDHDVLKIKYIKVLPPSDCGDWDRQDVENLKADFSKDIEITNYEIGKDTDQIALFNQGIALLEKRQYNRSIAYFDKAIELNPRYAEAYYNRGLAYEKKGIYSKAISEYTQAIEINPKYIDAYDNRGFLYYIKGQYDKAIIDCNMAIEINPNYAKAYYNRGNAYFHKKEYEKSWDDVYKAQNLGYKVSSEFLRDLHKASGREK